MAGYVKLRATVVMDYEAHPDNYGTSDPAEMAKIDRENWESDPSIFYEYLSDDFKITVEPR